MLLAELNLMSQETCLSTPAKEWTFTLENKAISKISSKELFSTSTDKFTTKFNLNMKLKI